MNDKFATPPDPNDKSLPVLPDVLKTALVNDLNRILPANTLYDEQRFKDVEPLILDYLKFNPRSWWGHYILGYALFGQRRIGDSIAALSQSLQLNINNADAHRLLGRNLMMIGRYDAAQIELEFAIKLRPQWPEVRYDLGKIHSARDNYPPARRELEEAIRFADRVLTIRDGRVEEFRGGSSELLGS